MSLYDSLELAVLSNMALRRLSASYFSGEFSDRLTEGLELVLGVIGVVGEYSGMDLGDPIPESTECGCSEPEEDVPDLPDGLLAPLDTRDDELELVGVWKLFSMELEEFKSVISPELLSSFSDFS